MNDVRAKVGDFLEAFLDDPVSFAVRAGWVLIKVAVTLWIFMFCLDLARSCVRPWLPV